MAEFQDRILKCSDCGAEFVFTAGEQHFFHDKNFQERTQALQGLQSETAGRTIGLRQNGNHYRLLAMRPRDHRAVPPTQGRPVFCRECFQSRKTQAAGA